MEMKPPQRCLSFAAAKFMLALYMAMSLDVLKVYLDTNPVTALPTTQLCQLGIVV